MERPSSVSKYVLTFSIMTVAPSFDSLFPNYSNGFLVSPERPSEGSKRIGMKSAQILE